MNEIENLKRRMARLETLVIGAKGFEAFVTNVNDPEGNNRIKVECANIWGTGNESPWLIDCCNVGGASKGEVWTPTEGDSVSVRLRDGKPDAGEWVGAYRSTRSPIPSEFSDPDINGRKTKSGILVVFDDNLGAYRVTVPSGGEVYLDGGGIAHITGTTIITHGITKLNEGGFGITSECDICPFSGKGHSGSTTCKVAP